MFGNPLSPAPGPKASPTEALRSALPAAWWERLRSRTRVPAPDDTEATRATAPCFCLWRRTMRHGAERCGGGVWSGIVHSGSVRREMCGGGAQALSAVRRHRGSAEPRNRHHPRQRHPRRETGPQSHGTPRSRPGHRRRLGSMPPRQGVFAWVSSTGTAASGSCPRQGTSRVRSVPDERPPLRSLAWANEHFAVHEVRGLSTRTGAKARSLGKRRGSEVIGRLGDDVRSGRPFRKRGGCPVACPRTRTRPHRSPPGRGTARAWR